MSEYVTTLEDGTRIASCAIDTLPGDRIVEVGVNGKGYGICLHRDIGDGECDAVEKARSAFIKVVDGRLVTSIPLSHEAMMAIVLMYAELQKEETP